LPGQTAGLEHAALENRFDRTPPDISRLSGFFVALRRWIPRSEDVLAMKPKYFAALAVSSMLLLLDGCGLSLVGTVESLALIQELRHRETPAPVQRS
jgi:hypothetical protein